MTATHISVIFAQLLVTIFVIGLIVFLYRYFYKRQLNRKLLGQDSGISLIDPFNFILVIMLIVVIIIGVIGNSRLKELKESQDDLAFYNRHVLIRINDANSNINALEAELNELKEQLAEESKWVNASSYEYLELSEDQSEIITSVVFDFKEVEADQTIYVLATNIEDEQDSMKFEVTSENYKYEATINLNKSKNYKIEVVGETSMVVKKEELFYINVNDDFGKDIISVNYGIELEDPEEELVVIKSAGITYKHGGIDALKMDKLEIFTLIDGTESVKDITNDVSTWDTQTTVEIKLDFVALNITPSNTDAFKIVLTDQSGNQYFVEGDIKEYKGNW